MYFENFADLMTMSGHGVYVWGVVCVSLLVLGAMSVIPVLQYRRRMRQLEGQPLSGGQG